MSNYKKVWNIYGISISFSLYVDSIAGDDLLGDGTAQRPFKSIDRTRYVNQSYKICLKGYFSENIAISDDGCFTLKYGDAILDGKNIRSLVLHKFTEATSSLNELGLIIKNYKHLAVPASFSDYYNFVLINSEIPQATANSCLKIRYAILDNVKLSSLAPVNSDFSLYGLYDIDRVIFRNIQGGSPCYYYGTANWGQPSNSINNLATPRLLYKCIFDNVKIWLNPGLTNDPQLNHKWEHHTCLFRVNCTFWAVNADGEKVRVDNDSMTAAQKEAAVNDWISNPVNKRDVDNFNMFTNCRFTDNKILQVSDDPALLGIDLDYGLIYGPEHLYPACYMDNGKPIGPTQPSTKFILTPTANLTSNPFEIEIKPEYNLDIVNNTLKLNPGFTSCEITSKIIPIPVGTEFNGINIPYIMGDGLDNRIMITSFRDTLDLSEDNKITLSNSTPFIPNVLKKCYYVKTVGNSFVEYKGNYYINGNVITAVDTTDGIICSEGGEAYLYPMFRPSIINSIKFKFFEINVDPPSDFLTNDVKYPWLDADTFLPAATNGVDTKMTTAGNRWQTIGFRVLRVGNTKYGAIDVGTDGRPLTSAHPESYIGANFIRERFKINAKRIAFKINIDKF